MSEIKDPRLELFKQLYESTKIHYLVPSFDEFVTNLQDSDQMFQLRQSLERYYDMPTFDQMLTDFGVKKKGQSEQAPLESSFDSAGFLQQEETEAKATLQEQLAGKGYNVEETGIGDALTVTNTLTGEQQEIDLQPVDIRSSAMFEGTNYAAAEAEKVRKLVNTPTSPKESVLSILNAQDYMEDTDSFVDKMKDLYGNRFDIQKTGGEVTIKKGDIEKTFKVQDIIPADIRRKRIGSSKTNEQAFFEINKFLFDNMNDDDVSVINENISFNAKAVNEAINNISTEINIDDDTVNGKLYTKEYYNNLINQLEDSGVEVSEEAKKELSPGGVTRLVTSPGGYMGAPVVSEVFTEFSEEERSELLKKHFSPEEIDLVNNLDRKQKADLKIGLIDRAKKLKTEKYYENSPNRETQKAIIRLNSKNLSEKEVDIRATLALAVKDHSRILDETRALAEKISESNPDITIKTIIDPETNQITDIVSSKPIEEVEELRRDLKSSQKNLYDLYNKSNEELDYISSELETSEEFIDAGERNYNLVDTVWSDVKMAATEAGGDIAILASLTKEGLEDVFGLPPTTGVSVPIIRQDMADERESVSKYRARKRTYEEAISEGTKARFAARTVADQSVNIGLAIATAGAGSAVGLSKAGVSTLISSEFGLTSAGATYDAITTRQEQGALAKKELEELEKYKGVISDQEYFDYKYDLERASKDADISATDKTLAVIGTGLVEFGVSRFIGTGVNALKVTKNLKAPKKFLDNIYRSNYKAAADGLKELGKSTLGEIGEEVAIGVGGKLINYATMGDELDFSDLDDIAVTSIITSGAMNTPGTSYGTFMTQVNSGRYKSAFEQKRKEIQSLKNLLNDDALSEQQRDNIHQRISKSIQAVAGITTEMEADVVLMGADDIKESLMLSNLKHKALGKAGVKPEDTQDMVKAKIKTYIESLDKEDSERYIENLKYVDSRKKEITGTLDYDNAIEKVFGEKGAEQAKKLDKSLTPKEKYTEIYKQFRENVNQKAKENFDKIIKEAEKAIVPPTIAPPTTEGLGDPKANDLKTQRESEIKEKVTDAKTPEDIQKDFEEELDDNQELLNKIGDKYNEGDNLSADFKDETSKDFEGEPYEVITNISKPGVLTDGKLTQAGKVTVTRFDNKEAADQWFSDRAENMKVLKQKRLDRINKKYDSKLEETESKKDTESKTPKSRKKQLTDLLESTKPKKVDVQNQVDNALKAISEVAPDVEIIVSDSEQDYISKGGKSDTAGTYQKRKDRKVIYINPSKVNPRTVAHEIFHALLLSKGMSDKRATEITAKMMKAVSKSASPELRRYLEDYSKEYKSNIQNEEKLAELFGKLASEFDSLPDSTKNIIKRWLDKLAKIVGLKEFTDAEVIDLLNTVSGKVARGEVISKDDISIFSQTGTEIRENIERFQASFSDIVSGLTYEYEKNTIKFKKIASKYIKKDKTLSDFDGKFVILHQPDMAFSGTIKKGDQVLVSGKGGVFYPIKFHDKGYFWASTKKAADKMAKSMNETLEKNGGKIYLALTTSPRDKTLSSTNMSNGVLDLYMNLSKDPKINISEDKMMSIVVDSYNKVFSKNKVSKTDSKENILKKIRETLGPDESVFNERKSFSVNIISQSAEIISTSKESSEYVADIFGKGAGTFDLMEGVAVTKTSLIRATTQLLSEPILRSKKKADDSGKIYAILEIEGEVEAVDAKEEGDHESYPKAIKSKNGNKTTLHLLKDRKTWKNTIIDPDTGKQVGDRKVISKDPEKAEKGKMVSRHTQVMSPSAGITFQGVEIDTNPRYQVEVSEARSLVEIGLKNGFTLAEINEVASERGIAASDISAEFDRVNLEKRIAGQKAEKMYIEGGVVKQFLAKGFKKTFSGKGFLPKSMQVLKEWMNGSIEADAKQASQAISDFVKATKKYSKEELSENTVFLDEYMRGDLSSFDKLQDELKPIAKRMRTHIDTLTKTLVSSGVISTDISVENMMQNIGSYMTRSYKIHDNIDYSPTESVVNAAKNYLRNNSTELKEKASEIAKASEGELYNVQLNKLVDQKIKEILKEDSPAEISGKPGKVGSKKTKGLKQRLDIPKEIRDLMGEYKSPIIGYVKSIQKISNLLANQKYLNGVKEAGDGVFLFNEPTDEFNVKIAGDESKTMNPLNGMYTSPEIAAAMSGASRVDLSDYPSVEFLYKAWLKSVGAVKYSKTILSPATHAKNIIGNIYFMAINGYIDPREYRKAFGIIMNDLKGKDNTERRAILDEYIRAGIINQSATLGDINALFDRNNPFEDIIESNSDTEGKALSLTDNSATRKAKKFGELMSSLYQAEDDMFKIIAYENEKSRYLKAKEAKLNKLSGNEKANLIQEIKNIAAENVKNILPNYGRIGQLVKDMKAAPIFGTFISFTVEAMRTSANTIALMDSELRDPELRSIGLKRMAGIAIAGAAKIAIISQLGIDDEDDEITEAAREILPHWHKNSTIYIESLKEGELVYSSVSDVDPHAFIDKFFVAGMRAESLTSAISESLYTIVEPFVSTDILFNAISQIVRNENAYGTPLYSEDASLAEKTKARGVLAWKVIEPGGVKTLLKLVDAGLSDDKSFWNELKGQATGIKKNKVDIVKQSGFNMRRLKDRANQAGRGYNSAYRKFKNYDKDVSLEDLERAYDESNESYKRVMKEAGNMYEVMLKLNVPSSDIYRAMKPFNKEEKSAIFNGYVINKKWKQ